jgi:hypothetical protein
VFFLDDTLAIVWLVIMVVGTVVLKVADVSLHRFWPFATALLVSVPIVGGVYLAIKAAKHPVAQPIAILLKDGSTQDGLFVAESDTRVWAGKASGRNGDGYLFWVDRKLVRTYAIGPVQEQDHALLRAQELVSELDRFKPGVKDTPAATESVVCTITHGKRRRISEKRSFTRPVASKPACG